MLSRGANAALAGLRFSPESEFALRGLSAEDWPELLNYCDRHQLTLLFYACARHLTPPRIAEQMEARREAQGLRIARLKQTFLDLDIALRAEGIEYMVLKGFTHCPAFLRDLETRVQYDLDLYCPRPSVRKAYDTLREIGYEPARGYERFPLDHLPTLLRKTGWEWRGDFFDPEIPASVELHFRFWDVDTERLIVRGLDDFWERRVRRHAHDLEFTALHPVDGVGYASLHLVRHLLRGDLRPMHLYEMASFLQAHAGEHGFWSQLRATHDVSLRRIEAVSFRLASHAFSAPIPPELYADIAALPSGVHRWFEGYADPAAIWALHSSKAELWLHLSMLTETQDRLAVFMRRLLPRQLPGPVDAVHLPSHRITWKIRVRSASRYMQFVSKRAAKHLRLLIPTLLRGIQWCSEDAGISPSYWRFLAAAAVFEFGLFVFYLLYNLLLLERGFHEDFLGATAAAMQTGAIAGTIPGGLAMYRWGIRPVLAGSFGLLGAVLALRVLVVQPMPLLVLAFVSGALAACWAICIPPTIAELSSEKAQPFAFSLFFSTGIGLGIVGGLVGGLLPRFVMGLGVPATSTKAAVLLLACVLPLVAAVLVLRVHLIKGQKTPETLYPNNPVLIRLLVILVAFHLGTGAFNPLYSAYLTTRANLGVERLGAVFAISQFAQILALLVAPLIIKRFGPETSILFMFTATGLALLAFAAGPAGMLAALLYVCYMSFQYMSEPGLYHVLMSCVSANQRRGASTLNFLVINTAQAIAAFVGGWFVGRAGYTPVFEAAAASVVLAAILVRVLLAPRATTVETTSATSA